MSDEMIVRQCAPTLAGIKTGSLFPCPCDDREALLTDVRRLNRQLVPKGLCLLPIRFKDGQALLYLYRPSNLRQDLKDRLAAQVLEQAGYSCSKSEQCVVRLIRRLKENVPLVFVVNRRHVIKIVFHSVVGRKNNQVFVQTVDIDFFFVHYIPPIK